jgi:hypothetical protein
MIIHKRWIQQSKVGPLEWEMEGWYLFGFIPLFKRDLQLRGRFGKKQY